MISRLNKQIQGPKPNAMYKHHPIQTMCVGYMLINSEKEKTE